MKVKVSKLTPHPLNLEIYDLSSIEDLMASITEMGLLQNLVIDQDNQVVSGNRRLEAIKRLGWIDVQCDRIEMSPTDAGSYLVHYNKQRVKTCRELLNEVNITLPRYKLGQGKRSDLTSVPQNKGYSARDKVAQDIGISSSQIGKLLFIEKQSPELIDLIDQGILTISQAYLQTRRWKKEEESREPRSRSRSFKESSSFLFYKKSSDTMLEIEDSDADLIFTSPPYWNKRKYTKNGGLGNERYPDDYVQNLTSHLDGCFRVLNETGSFFLNLGDTYQDGNLLNIPHRVILGLQDRGWMLRNTIIWSKTNPKPSSSKTNLTPTYEFIFHLVKELGYKYDQILAPLKHTTRSSHSPRHRNLSSGKSKPSPYIPRNGKNIGDFWTEEIVRSAVVNQFSTDSTTEHPAPFPEDIVTIPLLQTTEQGDLVIDPFMGTGTTGKVANQYGRRFIGYDIQTY